jgi:hypothetical protein
VTPPYVADIVTDLEVDTALVVTTNDVLVLPEATVTVDGTTATAVLLLDSETTAPAPVAPPVSVTVAVEIVPPTTVDGASDREATAGTLTLRVADFETPWYAAVIVTDVVADTAFVVTRKVAVVAPAATVTLAGTLATAPLLVASVTCAPAEEAGAVRVTVPVDVSPPVTLVGVSASVLNCSGVMVSADVRVAPPSLAVTFAVVATETE